MARKIPIGTPVIINGKRREKGVLVDTTTTWGSCKKHNLLPRYLVRMNWTSSCWLMFVKCVYFPFQCVYFPLKYLFKYTGITLCLSWIFQRCSCPSWAVKWFHQIANYCLLFLGRYRRVCTQEMEEEAGYGRRLKTGHGIQGFNNSCYLDAFLFSMFYASKAFDKMLEEARDHEDQNQLAVQTRKILRDLIATPLRVENFVPARHVLELRKLLSQLNPNIMGSFMAIEDIVYILFRDALQTPKSIHYSIELNPQHPHFHSDFMNIMTVDLTDPSPVITIQRNFEASMEWNGNMRLRRVPSPALILSLPWNGNKMCHHDAIIPTFELDVGVLMSNGGTMCTNCGLQEAIWESVLEGSEVPEWIVCGECVSMQVQSGKTFVDRRKMKLTSLMCYRGAHFTTFVCRQSEENGGPDEWLRFDSMAGISPVIVPVEKLTATINSIISAVTNGGRLPSQMTSHAKAFCYDGHTCIYEPIFFQ